MVGGGGEKNCGAGATHEFLKRNKDARTSVTVTYPAAAIDGHSYYIGGGRVVVNGWGG